MTEVTFPAEPPNPDAPMVEIRHAVSEELLREKAGVTVVLKIIERQLLRWLDEHPTQ